MLDFYHEIAGLESEMTLNELKQELLKQEKVWKNRHERNMIVNWN